MKRRITLQGAALNKTKEKMPGYVLVLIVLYLVGAIFWNAWFVNYSDYIINEAAIGDASVARPCRFVKLICLAVSQVSL